MRNSKKLIAVIMTIAILASMMVPALAASYQTEADKLMAAGLMKGTGAGAALESKLDRIQGITFTLRAMGVEAAALAMTDADADAALATVEDAASIPAWGKKIAAYAIKNNITNGVGSAVAGKIKFASSAPLSGTQFVTMMLRALGYTGITLTNALDKAVEVGMLGAGKTVAFGTKAQLLRDDAAFIIYSTVNNGKVALAGGVTPSATTLVSKLVADGALTATLAAANFTFTVATPAPAASLTFSAVSVNAKQFLLTFNQAINATDGADESLYALSTKTVGDTTVQADGKSVLLTLTGDEALGNNSTLDITVKSGFRNAAGTKLAADFKVSGVAVYDTTFPTFDSVKAVGLKTLRLYFSEPVWGGSGTSAAISTSLFEVKNATYTWAITGAKLNTLSKYVELTMGTNLVEGTLNVTAKDGLVDYAGNKVAPKTIAFTFAKDATAPVATIKSATQSEVVVKFDKPVYGDLKVAHTVKDTYNSDTGTSGLNVAETAAKDEWTFAFTTNKLPGGNVTIFVSPVTDKTVTDLYGNKFVASSMTYALTADVTAPVISSVTKNDNTSLTVTFDEVLDTSTAQTLSNYTLKKVSDGSNVPFTVAYTAGEKKITVTPYSVFADNTAYQLTITKVKDLLGNVNSANLVETFTIGDNTKPSISSDTFYVGDSGKIYVYFSEPMNATAMVNKANYMVASTGAVTGAVALGDNDTVTAMSDKIVLIDMNTMVTAPSIYVASAVTDLAGKKLSDNALQVSYGPISTETFAIDSAVATATNKIKITFTKEVSAFNNLDFVVTAAGAAAATISGVDSVSGKEVVISLSTDLRTNAVTTPAGAMVSVAAIAAPQTTASVYGTKIAANSVATVTDKIVPVVTKDASGNYNVLMNIATSGANIVTKGAVGTVTIRFSEAMKTSTFSTLTYSVAGYTINSVSPNAVSATTGYHDIVLNVTCDALNTTATPAVTQNATIADVNDNIIASGTVYTAKYVGP